MTRAMPVWMCALVGVLLLPSFAAAQTPLTTTFTYQGRLNDGAVAADGFYDLRFQLTDAASLGLLLQTIDVPDVDIVDGTFTVNLTFNSTHFVGDRRWLAIGVRDGASAGAYTTLSPRQEVTAAPFALYAVKPWEKNGTELFYENGRVRIGAGASSGRATVRTSSDIYGLFVESTTSTGFTDAAIRAVGPDKTAYLTHNGTANFGAAILAEANGGSGETYTIWATNNSSDTDSMAMRGQHDGNGTGVYGRSVSGEGVYGQLSGTSGNAARFEATNASHNSDAVYVTKSGGGRCMQLYVPDGGAAMPLYAVTYGPARAASFEAHDSNSTATVSCFKNNGPALLVTGSVGSGELPSLTAPVSIIGGDDASLSGDGYLMLGNRAGTNIVIDNNEIMARSNGASATLFLNNDGGTVRVPVLEIVGADMAERFPVSGDAAPGTVMVLDPANPGQLCMSTSAYDKKVAGVVSGAGDIPVGAILGNLPGSEDHPPIAMNGRVWVKCDAASGAIEVGDLLTTSATPGHAMKSADAGRSHGCVIGKAMSTLAAGEQGLVLVLVNLQ